MCYSECEVKMAKKGRPTNAKKTELLKFRITKNDKDKLLDHFGSYSAIRDYVLGTIEGKGKMNLNEVKK